jgi:YidC/Oxa1 family membrane protein insertase
MIQLFNVILFQPLLNILVFFYNTIAFHDLGLAIIFLTILVRLIIYPLSLSQIKSQRSLAGLQEKVNVIRKQYADDKQKQTQAIMELYRQNKVNPFSSCFSLIIQFPILIAVYEVFRRGILTDQLPLYSFIQDPGKLNTIAFGFLDLSAKSFLLALLTGVTQFFQTKMMSRKKLPAAVKKDPGAKDESILTAMNKNMLYFFPLLTVVIGMSFASGLVFYWLISNLLTILQQKILFRQENKKEISKS